MNTISMAIKNIKKSLSFYALYLFSISLVITVFFAFTSFSTNKIMLEKISSDGRVETMSSVILVFLMIFVIFYMSYSNRFFLRRRTKELGIYSLLGYRKSTVLSLLTIENILICGGAFIIGIGLGALMHKAIVLGITTLLKLSIDNTQIPFFNLSAICKTAYFILLVIIVLSLSNGRFLIKASLMDLVRFEQRSEKALKFRFLPALIGFIMIISGYGLALDILRGDKSFWFTLGFYPIGMATMLLIVIGTVFFISSFLPYLINKSRNSKKIFYTATNIITTPNFIYRIRSNSKTLIMITLLSAATLTVSSVMALTLYYPIASVSRMAPSEIEFRIEDEKQIDNIKQIVHQTIPNNDKITFTQTDIYKVTSTANKLPEEYNLGSSKGDAQNEKILRESGFEAISYSDYTSLLKAQGKGDIANSLIELNDNEAILVKYEPNSDKNSEVGDSYPLIIGDNTITLTVKETTLANPISFANSIGTLIVSDDIYNQIKSNTEPITRVMSINGKVIDNNEFLFKSISEELDNSPYLQSNSHRINYLFSMNSSTFLLVGFLVVLFFIATGSILYFNNISAVSDTKDDYNILVKMGYTPKQLKKIIRKQVLIFFSIPFILGLIDSIFATIIYKKILMQNLLGNSYTQYVPVILAITLTAVIYLTYYLITIRTCYKTILNK